MTALLATSWKLAVSAGQVGKFKVLGLLDSAVLEHGQVCVSAARAGWRVSCA